MNIKFVVKRLGTSVKMIEEHYGHVLEDREDDAIGGLPPMGFGVGNRSRPGQGTRAFHQLLRGAGSM